MMCNHEARRLLSPRPALHRCISRIRQSRVRFHVALLGAALSVTQPLTGQTTHKLATPTSAANSSLADSVFVTDAWARPALKGGTGGAYMTITNKTHSMIRIVSAVSTAAAAAELHVSTVHDGVATMEMLPNLVITPGASVSLKPGATHFMLVRLRKALVKGDITRLTLRLQNGGTVVVNVAVRAQ